MHLLLSAFPAIVTVNILNGDSFSLVISFSVIAALSAGVPIQILPGEPVEALAREPTSHVDAVGSRALPPCSDG